jgi:hypothetical protein
VTAPLHATRRSDVGAARYSFRLNAIASERRPGNAACNLKRNGGEALAWAVPLSECIRKRGSADGSRLLSGAQLTEAPERPDGDP